MKNPFFDWRLPMELLNDAPDSNHIAVLYTRDANPFEVIFPEPSEPSEPSEPALVDGITPTYSPVFERALADCSKMHDFQIPVLHMEQRNYGVYMGDIALINLSRFQPKSHSVFSTVKSVRLLKKQLQILFPEHAPKLYGYFECPAPTLIPVGT